MSSPEVSVIIPAYNAERTIGETLDSVLSQTFKDFEAIVVDDGSRDRTAEVARSTGDARVRVLSVENGGVARARNRGMDSAAGELIALLDSDDLWRPDKLKRQVTLLADRPDIGMCFVGAGRIDGQGGQIGEMQAHDYPDWTAALLLHSMVISASCSSGMFRRSLLPRVEGFDPAFSQSADWDFWLRLSRVTHFAPIDEMLVMYRTSVGNMSSDIGLLERDSFAVLDKLFAREDFAPYLPARAQVLSNHWMICAGSYLHARQVGDAVRCLARGLRAYPANVRRPLGLPVRWARRLAAGAQSAA